MVIFWGILELIGKYDEVTRQHLAKVKQQQLGKKDHAWSSSLSVLEFSE